MACAGRTTNRACVCQGAGGWTLVAGPITIIVPSGPDGPALTHMKEEGCSARAPPSQLPLLSPLLHILYLSSCGMVPTQPRRPEKGWGTHEPDSVSLHLLPLSPTALSPPCWHPDHIQLFYMGAGDSNSDSNACTAGSPHLYVYSL